MKNLFRILPSLKFDQSVYVVIWYDVNCVCWIDTMFLSQFEIFKTINYFWNQKSTSFLNLKFRWNKSVFLRISSYSGNPKIVNKDLRCDTLIRRFFLDSALFPIVQARFRKLQIVIIASSWSKAKIARKWLTNAWQTHLCLFHSLMQILIHI